ncbi:MAG TPA: nicotinamide-nucleotide adenylyltransferase [Candidatus Aenigmarchaeota archaeon]|nr:nicotinamide-nucleotide adenylyltransferase [Candidatus Aenigmarchaeota archaeon]
MRVVFVGRFQPLHLGHVHAIKKVIKEYGDVVIVIGSINKHDKNNPFTFEERKRMIESVFPGVKIIGVLDVNDDSLWVKLIEQKVKFDIIVTGNDWTKRCFENAGYKVIKPDFLEPEKYSATRIRELMRKNDDSWRKLVPKEVEKIIEEINGVERVKKLSQTL